MTLKNVRYFFFTVFALSGCGCNSYWSQTIDQVTQEDSWETYREFYAAKSSAPMTRVQINERVRSARVTDLTSDQFLSLHIENHRLGQYFSATTAEEAYPIHDRPRHQRDIDAVNYFLSPSIPVSPITVGIIPDQKGVPHLIKLDGVHRIMAVHIRKELLRVLWIDLRNK